jgi:hypothetical protein
MKMIFFLIAFFLICIRYYFSWSGKEQAGNGSSVSDMVVKTDTSIEEMNYSGKFQLSDDETGFKNISPGGYFKFRFNDVRVKAESNLQGGIDYTVYDGKRNLGPGAEQKIYISRAIREMVEWGFDGKARMERIYQKGGTEALIKEVDNIKPDNIKVLYLDRLIQLDSGSNLVMPQVIKKISHLGNDQDKVRILEKFSAAQWQDSATNRACFELIASLGSDVEKIKVLDRMIRQDSLSGASAENILQVSGSVNSEIDRAGLYERMMDRGLIAGNLTDSLLGQVKRMGSGPDKAQLYGHFLSIKNMSDAEWMELLQAVSLLDSEMDKAGLLVQIAPEMPKNEVVRAQYLKAAKTIGNDSDYGKVLRAVE